MGEPGLPAALAAERALAGAAACRGRRRPSSRTPGRPRSRGACQLPPAAGTVRSRRTATSSARIDSAISAVRARADLEPGRRAHARDVLLGTPSRAARRAPPRRAGATPRGRRTRSRPRARGARASSSSWPSDATTAAKSPASACAADAGAEAERPATAPPARGRPATRPSPRRAARARAARGTARARRRSGTGWPRPPCPAPRRVRPRYPGRIRSSTGSPVSSACSACRRTVASAHEPPTNPSTVPSPSTSARSPGRALVGATQRTTVASTKATPAASSSSARALTAPPARRGRAAPATRAPA